MAIPMDCRSPPKEGRARAPRNGAGGSRLRALRALRACQARKAGKAGKAGRICDPKGAAAHAGARCSQPMLMPPVSSLGEALGAEASVPGSRLSSGSPQSYSRACVPPSVRTLRGLAGAEPKLPFHMRSRAPLPELVIDTLVVCAWRP